MPYEIISGLDPFSSSAVPVGADDDYDDVGYEEIIGEDDDYDEVGDDDDWIYGDDDEDDDMDVSGDLDEEIGARRRRRRRRRPRGRRRLPRRRSRRRSVRRKARKGVVTANVTPGKARYLSFGATATTTLAGALDVGSTVQEAIKPTRLIVTGLDISGASPVLLAPETYDILDILVGVKSQLASLGAINGSMFTANTTLQFAGFDWDTCQPGTNFTCRIANAPANSQFNISVAGIALR